jgi:taurine transport system substrate-binding protein
MKGVLVDYSKRRIFGKKGQRATAVSVALLALLLVAALAIVVSGCGSSSSSSSSASPTAAGAPKEIRIAYQLIPNGDLIVKDQGWLEAAFPGTTIKWVKFDSGADVNTAIIGGSVDIGLAGSSPVAAGLSSPMNIAYKVPWIHDVIGAAESLVVKNSAGVTDIKGLAGKKVGTPFGSTAHYSLLAALELNGVDPATVKIIDLQPPDILAAWQRGDIDGAYVWNPTLAELKKDGTTLITSEELAKQGKLTADLAVVTNAFADQYPDAVQTWVDQQDKAVKMYKSDPQAAADAVGRQLNISGADALAQMKDLILLDASEQAGADYLGTPAAPGKLADNLESASQFLKSQGSVEAVPALSAFQAALGNQYVAKASGQ